MQISKDNTNDEVAQTLYNFVFSAINSFKMAAVATVKEVNGYSESHVTADDSEHIYDEVDGQNFDNENESSDKEDKTSNQESDVSDKECEDENNNKTEKETHSATIYYEAVDDLDELVKANQLSSDEEDNMAIKERPSATSAAASHPDITEQLQVQDDIVEHTILEFQNTSEVKA